MQFNTLNQPLSKIDNELVEFSTCYYEKNKNLTITNVARKNLIDLGASLAIGTAVSYFVDNPLEMIKTYASRRILFEAVLALLTAGSALGSSNFFYNAPPTRKKLQNIFTKYVKNRMVSDALLRPISFACSTSGPYAGTLIHEAGHAAAQKLLFQNCHPEIIVHADGSGFARYNYIPGLDWRKLTYFGENLIGDPIRAEGIVALMGPVADLVASCSTLALGLKASSKRPELSNYLLAHSYARIANLFSYAISPLFYSNLGSEHDFQSIRERLGIHPLAAAVTILALPILTYKVFAPKNESST